MEGKAVKYSGPAGAHTNALQISFAQVYSGAGIQSETYLPYVGLVEHVVDNIAGARKYSLVLPHGRDGSDYAGDSFQPVGRCVRIQRAISLAFPSGRS